MPPLEAGAARRPQRIAHRGRHDAHMENTMEAFRAAYADGCDMVEFDVQLSRDGVPVIFHDDDCKRLAGRRDNVFDLDWKDLQAVRIPGRGGKAGGIPGREYRIPSLEEFLSEFAGRDFYLELKVPDAKAGDAGYYGRLSDLAAAMVGSSRPRPETFLASFHGGILAHLARRDGFPRLAGIFESYGRFKEVHSGADKEVTEAIRYYSVSHRIWRKHLEDSGAGAADQAGENFLIWNIEGEKDFRAAMAHGIYGLCSDDVGGLMEL